jgi:hypothetical protein
VGGGAFADDETGDGIFFSDSDEDDLHGPCHHFAILRLSNRRWFVRLRTITTSVWVIMMSHMRG